jgi:hypothetical protein
MLIFMQLCFACGDGGEVWSCKGTRKDGEPCRLNYCLAAVRGGAGCIEKDTMVGEMTEDNFLCPRCVARAGKTMPVSAPPPPPLNSSN